MERIISLQEFEQGRILSCVVREKKLALVKIGEQVFAFDDECTHEKYPLHEGIIENTILECVHHGAKFDLRTGKVLALPAIKPLRVYQTEIKNGEVWVEVGND